jgi:hypothetical protein
MEYTRPEPIGPVAVEAINDTGHALPMPPAGLIEQAVRVVTQQAAPASSIVDTFAETATAHLADRQVRVVASGTQPIRRLRVSLTGWDVNDAAAAAAVVFVSVDYQLLDEHGELLWQMKQERWPVRLSGPNLSRYEVTRTAEACVDAALTSLAGPH